MHFVIITETLPWVFLVFAFSHSTSVCQFRKFFEKHNVKIDISGCMTNFTTKEQSRSNSLEIFFREALFTENDVPNDFCCTYDSGNDLSEFRGEFTLFYKLGKNICEANNKTLDCKAFLNEPMTCIGNYDPDFNCSTCIGNFDIGTGCSTCLGNFDPGTGCSTCIENYDPGTGCSTCIENYDPGTGCSTCIENYDPGTGCSTCIENYDPGTGCSTCIENYDPGTGCSTSIENYDPGTGCSTCIENYDPGTGCSICLGNFDLASQCTNCTWNWAGDFCDLCGFGLTGPDCLDCATNVNWIGEYTFKYQNGAYVTFNVNRKDTDFRLDFSGPGCQTFTGIYYYYYFTEQCSGTRVII